jgi:hypothetical protein
MITGSPLPPPWEYPSRSGLLKARGGLTLFMNCLEEVFSETELRGNKKGTAWHLPGRPSDSTTVRGVASSSPKKVYKLIGPKTTAAK